MGDVRHKELVRLRVSISAKGPPRLGSGLGGTRPEPPAPLGAGGSRVLTGLYLGSCAWWKNTWATERQAKSGRGQAEQLPGAALEGLRSETAVSAPACLNQ